MHLKLPSSNPLRNGYDVWFEPCKKCATVQAWLFWYAPICGTNMYRIFGITFYPRWK